MTTYTTGTKWEIVDYDATTDTYSAIECVIVALDCTGASVLTDGSELRDVRFDDLLPVGEGQVCAAEMNA